MKWTHEMNQLQYVATELIITLDNEHVKVDYEMYDYLQKPYVITIDGICNTKLFFKFTASDIQCCDPDIMYDRINDDIVNFIRMWVYGNKAPVKYNYLTFS